MLLVKNCPKPEMDTNFCTNWQGDRKAKFCRICAVDGSPCFRLWAAVKIFAERKFVLENRRPGRAFGHRYQIEPSRKNPSICYIQTLQDKMAHFGLPIEDFLYVTKTGLGGMYETPSRTKQNPFVSLFLEAIASDPQIPDGSEIIAAVCAIPRKNQIEGLYSSGQPM